MGNYSWIFYPDNLLEVRNQKTFEGDFHEEEIFFNAGHHANVGNCIGSMF
jgi:hypothetical protein